MLLADGALLYRRERLWHAARAPETRIWFPRSEAIPSGYLASGLRYGPGQTAARCFAVLYTSADCKYCSAQQPEWRNLVKRARQLSCDALRVPPARSAETAPGSGRGLGREFAFVGPGWVRGQSPEITPTLVIFARGAGSAWCHVGAVDPKSTRAAESAIEAAAATGVDQGPHERGQEQGRLQCY